MTQFPPPHTLPHPFSLLVLYVVFLGAMIINPTWEACFVADTHAMKSSRVWEAYFAADTQNVKTGRYNKGTLYSKMFVVGVLYFGSIQKK